MTQGHNAETFKLRDAASYDSLTREFDAFTEWLSRPLAARLLALAQLQPSERVLDVGTGTGVVALQAAQEVGPAGKVLGVDFSEAMLATAREKMARLGLAARLEFRCMDAEALELPDGCFDAVLSLFALLHFPDPLAALEEMFRVLRPGGRLVVAVGSGPQSLSLPGVIEAFRHVRHQWLKRQGKLLVAPGFLDDLTRKHLPEPREPEESPLARRSRNRSGIVPRLVRRAGFRGVRSEWHGHRAVVDTAKQFWDLQRTFSSIARKRLGDAAAEKVEHLREEFLARCREVQSRGGKLVYPFAAFFVVGERPLQS